MDRIKRNPNPNAGLGRTPGPPGPQDQKASFEKPIPLQRLQGMRVAIPPAILAAGIQVRGEVNPNGTLTLYGVIGRGEYAREVPFSEISKLAGAANFLSSSAMVEKKTVAYESTNEYLRMLKARDPAIQLAPVQEFHQEKIKYDNFVTVLGKNAEILSKVSDRGSIISSLLEHAEKSRKAVDRHLVSLATGKPSKFKDALLEEGASLWVFQKLTEKDLSLDKSAIDQLAFPKKQSKGLFFTIREIEAGIHTQFVAAAHPMGRRLLAAVVDKGFLTNVQLPPDLAGELKERHLETRIPVLPYKGVAYLRGLTDFAIVSHFWPQFEAAVNALISAFNLTFRPEVLTIGQKSVPGIKDPWDPTKPGRPRETLLQQLDDDRVFSFDEMVKAIVICGGKLGEAIADTPEGRKAYEGPTPIGRLVEKKISALNEMDAALKERAEKVDLGPLKVTAPKRRQAYTGQIQGFLDPKTMSILGMMAQVQEYQYLMDEIKAHLVSFSNDEIRQRAAGTLFGWMQTHAKSITVEQDVIGYTLDHQDDQEDL